MAIVQPKFDNVGNKRSGTKAKKDNSSGDDKGSRTLGIYVDDNSFEKFYKNSVTSTNPVASALTDSEYGNESEHVQPYINKFKTVDLCFSYGRASTSMRWDPSGINFGNWRHEFVEVNDNVMLQLSDMSIEASVTENYDNLWDKVMGNKIVSTLDSAASNVRMFATAVSGNNNNLKAGKAYPRYKNVLVLKDISSLNLPSSLVFTFNYGSAGLYSCDQEVVRPILALVQYFMPYSDADTAFVNGIVPSNEYALSLAGRKIKDLLLGKGLFSKGALSSVSDANEDGSSGEQKEESGGIGSKMSSAITNASSKLANALTDIQNKIYDATNEAAKELLEGTADEGSKYRFLTLRIGRLVLPSMVPGTVKWKFDFAQVDEYGFPYKGEVSFDGLQTVESASSAQVAAPYS